MSNQFHQGVLRNPAALPGMSGKTSQPITMPAPGRAIVAFFKALVDTPNELLRMADEYESTRPELTARLRTAARRGWGW